MKPEDSVFDQEQRSSDIAATRLPNESVDTPYTEKDNNASMEEIDILPPEIQNAIPKEDQKIVNSMLSIAMSGSNPRGSSEISKKLTPEHIGRIIENSARESEIEYSIKLFQENTKRIGMGAILILVSIILFYAGITSDKVLAEKVLLMSISGVGGFGAGVGISSKKKE